MPPDPLSPLRLMNVERYAPGGGSSLLGDVAEEHAPRSVVQRIRGAATRIGPTSGRDLTSIGRDQDQLVNQKNRSSTAGQLYRNISKSHSHLPVRFGPPHHRCCLFGGKRHCLQKTAFKQQLQNPVVKQYS